MKNVLMITDLDDRVEFFDTVADAQKVATTLQANSFTIYTLYTVGTVGQIEWKLAVDTGTNLRENKKEAVKMRKGAWTQLEEDTLAEHYKKGDMSISEIATALRRKYNSVYTKLTALKLI